jgi:hypothetical protein
LDSLLDSILWSQVFSTNSKDFRGFSMVYYRFAAVKLVAWR